MRRWSSTSKLESEWDEAKGSLNFSNNLLSRLSNGMKVGFFLGITGGLEARTWRDSFGFGLFGGAKSWSLGVAGVESWAEKSK